jgi:hypothetical protein
MLLFGAQLWCKPVSTTCNEGISTINAPPENLKMINQDSIESLAKRISALLPADVPTVKEDIESSIQNLLQATLSRMQLVTREEFDVQSAVLQRTRDKLEKLEKQLEALQTEARE